MKIYILTDMEGISLVTEWDQVKQGHPYYPKYQKVLAAEVNAAIEGAIAAGAQRIVVNDGHGGADYHLQWELLNSKIEIERPDSAELIFPALDESFDALLLIGYHSMEGTPGGVLSHTQSHERIQYYEINGRAFGEIGQMALIAGDYRVPVAYISGDRAAVEEARSFLGEDLPGTAVKAGHPNGKATSLHPAESVRRIREGVEAALRLPRRKPFTIPGPYTVNIAFKQEEFADDAASSRPGAERLDAYTISHRVERARHILT